MIIIRVNPAWASNRVSEWRLIPVLITEIQVKILSICSLHYGVRFFSIIFKGVKTDFKCSLLWLSYFIKG